MSYRNWGRRSNADSQVEVYSPDGGTTFNWHYVDGDDWRLGGWNYANAKDAIEAAWVYLSGLGGGLMRTRGPGETWNIGDNRLQPIGGNVTWESDWGLIIQGTSTTQPLLWMFNIDNWALKGLHLYGAGTYSGANLYVENCDHSLVDRLWSENASGFNVRFEGTTFNTTIQNSHLDGAMTDAGNDKRHVVNFGPSTEQCSAIDNYIFGDWGDAGLNISGTHHRIADNIVDGQNCTLGGGLSWAVGIAIWQPCSDSDFTNNVIVNCEEGYFPNCGAATNYVERINIHGGTIENCDNGINFDSTIYVRNIKVEDVLIIGGSRGINGSTGANNISIDNCTIMNATSRPVNLYQMNDGELQNCWIDGGAGGGTAQIMLSGSPRWSIRNNRLINRSGGDGINLQGESDDVEILENYIDGDHGSNINITAATCDRTKVLYNTLLGAATLLTDSGVGTILSAKVFQFTEPVGTAAWQVTSPTGIVVDAADEGALALGETPLDVQQVVRFRVKGVCLDATGGGKGMLLEFIINAGKPAGSEAYNAEAIGVVSVISTEDDVAVDDAIEWVIDASDDADVDDITLGETIEMFGMFEDDGANGDIATNATLRTISIEYI